MGLETPIGGEEGLELGEGVAEDVGQPVAGLD